MAKVLQFAFDNDFFSEKVVWNDGLSILMMLAEFGLSDETLDDILTELESEIESVVENIVDIPIKEIIPSPVQEIVSETESIVVNNDILKDRLRRKFKLFN